MILSTLYKRPKPLVKHKSKIILGHPIQIYSSQNSGSGKILLEKALQARP